MRIHFRTLFLALGILSLICLLGPLLIGIISTALTYSGKCYGFTDSVSDCNWMQFASNEMFWAGMLLFLPALMLVCAWLAASGTWFFGHPEYKSRGLPAGHVVLIALAACAGSFLIAFILSITGI